jgi:hypothetical protein
LEDHQALEHLSDFEQAAILHLVRVLFEPVLPVGAAFAGAASQVLENLRHFGVFGDLPQPDVLDVRERDHDRHAGACEAQEIKAFKLAPKRAGADIFNSGDTLVRVNNFFANLKGHAGTSLSFSVSVHLMGVTLRYSLASFLRLNGNADDVNKKNACGFLKPTAPAEIWFLIAPIPAELAAKRSERSLTPCCGG